MSNLIEPICKNCEAWKEMQPTGEVVIGAPKRGACMMFPPVPYPVADASGRLASQGHMRPVPMEHESCMHFIARGSAANDAH